MNITHIGKVREGLYTISSVPCPKCNEVLTLDIEGSLLFQYHQGAHISVVLPNETPATRERFITGYCDPCWTALFGSDTEALWREYQIRSSDEEEKIGN